MPVSNRRLFTVAVVKAGDSAAGPRALLSLRPADVPEYAIQVISDWKDDPEGPCNQPGFVPENLKEKTEL